MFLKIQKVHHREFEVHKNCSRIYLFPNISQSIHILYFSSQRRREVLIIVDDSSF